MFLAEVDSLVRFQKVTKLQLVLDDQELENGYSLLSPAWAAKDHGWEEVAIKQEAGDYRDCAL